MTHRVTKNLRAKAEADPSPQAEELKVAIEMVDMMITLLKARDTDALQRLSSAIHLSAKLSDSVLAIAIGALVQAENALEDSAGVIAEMSPDLLDKVKAKITEHAAAKSTPGS
jgi:LytS/YehU family sensor histidine kinase